MATSTYATPQPPSISDPPAGRFVGENMGDVSVDAGREDSTLTTPDWLKRAREAYLSSTSYIDTNYRKVWDDAIRAFNSEHAGDSKYRSESFSKRSTIFRPKTRAVIRRNEAAAAAAFFSNVDRLSVQAVDQSSDAQRMSADVLKELLQYRLTKSIPWFQVVIGGLQDAQVQGSVAAHVYWRYVQRKDQFGVMETVEDQPCIDLIPIENIRVDSAADWTDPINSSPYVIHLIPVYVCDVRDRMERADPKGRKWRSYPDTVLTSLRANEDSTRQARLGTVEDPTTQRRTISDYDVVWVHRHIHRHGGRDWEFYTLASEYMLTDPEPLENTVFHGKRPYVMGCAILETHKPMKVPVPKMLEGLQQEANEVANQRLDNIKFVLNKRWFAKRGKNVDLASLVRNIPGGITLMDDVDGDVREVNWPDVTSSSYHEQDRIDSDFSDLAGNFDPMQVQSMKLGNASGNTMRMLQGPSNMLIEYMLKTYVETFVQPVLRHLVLLEQFYENDQSIIALAGKKARTFEKFGQSEVTDKMLEEEMTVSVNVGMAATDPTAKLQRFVYAIQAFGAVAAKPPPGLNMGEVAKEILGLSGYQDGERFTDDQDPQMAQAKAVIEQLQQQLQQAMQAAEGKQAEIAADVEMSREKNRTDLEVAAIRNRSADSSLVLGHLLDMDYMKAEAEMQSMQQPTETADAN